MMRIVKDAKEVETNGGFEKNFARFLGPPPLWTADLAILVVFIFAPPLPPSPPRGGTLFVGVICW